MQGRGPRQGMAGVGRRAAPSCSRSRGRIPWWKVDVVRLEQGLKGAVEEPGQAEGQGERRIVVALLVRDRRLAGHAQRVGQPGLRPAPRAAPGRDVVAHRSAPAAQGGVAHRELEDDERLGTLDGAADRVVPQPGLPNSTYRTWVMTPLR